MFLENSQNRDAGRKSPLADSFLSRISENELRHWVETISFPRHFEAEAAANKKAAAILTEWLQGMGYTVQEQGPWRNLLAGDPEKAKVIVGAHYDSVPGSPGADDNGSALAAMLGCAQALAEAAFRDELLFVAFNREEDDLMGSKDFVAEYQGPAEAAYILEMVGYASDETGSQKLPNLPIKLPDQGNFLGLVSNFQSRKLARSFLQCAHDHDPDFEVLALLLPPAVHKGIKVLRRSDHAPFWDKKIPALMLTDTAEFRNGNYHQASDTADTLNYQFLYRNCCLLTLAVAEHFG